MNLEKNTKKIRRQHVSLGIGAHTENYRALCSLIYFGFTDDDMAKGLGYIKNDLRMRYKKKLFDEHPDTSRRKGLNITKITNHYNRLKDLQIIPPSPFNLNWYIEIFKGYKTLEDINLPWAWIGKV